MSSRCRGDFSKALVEIHHLASGYDNQSCDRFEVTTAQLQQLHDRIQEFRLDFDYIQEHPSHWVERMYNTLFKNDKQRNDLLARATLMLDTAYQEGYKYLVYLDGHGRLTTCLLGIIHERNWYGFFQLYCVEIDSGMNQWHRMLFPTNVNCVNQDIFNFLDNFPQRNESLVYLNFCGLDDNLDYALDLIIRSPDSMISFSNRCGCAENQPTCRKCTSGILEFCHEHARYVYSNTHSSFYTFLFTQ